MTNHISLIERQLRYTLAYTQLLRYFCTQCIVKKHLLTEEERRLLEDLHEAYKKCLIFIGMALL